MKKAKRSSGEGSLLLYCLLIAVVIVILCITVLTYIITHRSELRKTYERNRNPPPRVNERLENSNMYSNRTKIQLVPELYKFSQPVKEIVDGVEILEDVDFFFPPPKGVPPEHLWR